MCNSYLLLEGGRPTSAARRYLFHGAVRAGGGPRGGGLGLPHSVHKWELDGFPHVWNMEGGASLFPA